MNAVFSIDKNRVKRSFSAAVNTYDEVALLQRKAGLKLLNKFHVDEMDVVVDIGCGTGFLTKELVDKYVFNKIIAIDIALSMVEFTRLKLFQNDCGLVGGMDFVCADAESLPLTNASVDKIVSNLALQWCQNLEVVFQGCRDTLNENGQLYFSTFGPATLKELKMAWSEVDDFNHVNDFYTAHEIIGFLKKSGFKQVEIETKLYITSYHSVLALMRELKGIGANNNWVGRNTKITSKAAMQKMISSYEKKSGKDLISATYEIFFISATI